MHFGFFKKKGVCWDRQAGNEMVGGGKWNFNEGFWRNILVKKWAVFAPCFTVSFVYI